MHNEENKKKHNEENSVGNKLSGNLSGKLSGKLPGKLSGKLLKLLVDVLLAGVLLVTVAWFQHGRAYLAGKRDTVSFVPNSESVTFVRDSESVSFVPDSESVPDRNASQGSAAENTPENTTENITGTVTESSVTGSAASSASSPVQYTGGIEFTFNTVQNPGSAQGTGNGQWLNAVQGTGTAQGLNTSGFSKETDPCKFAAYFTGETVLTEDTCSTPDMYLHITKYAAGERMLESPWILAEIYLRNPKDLRTAFAGGSYAAGRGSVTSNRLLAEQTGALLSVNGDYYISQNESLVVRNGALYRTPTLDYDALVMYNDGTMRVYSGAELATDAQIADAVREAWQAWSFGPSLLDENGRAKENFEGYSLAVSSRNPRTAIGYYESGHYCFVVVDGRTKAAKGCTFDDLSRLFEDLGCTLAYNMDGGASSSMVFNGNLVSHPAKERSVPDIIYIAEP